LYEEITSPSPYVQIDERRWRQVLAGAVACRFRRQTHVTPKSFLSFLEGYKTLYSEKLANLGQLAGRMTTGLQKLDEASESVDELSKELVIKEQDLVVANQKADTVRTSTCLPQDDDDIPAAAVAYPGFHFWGINLTKF